MGFDALASSSSVYLPPPFLPQIGADPNGMIGLVAKVACLGLERVFEE